MSKHSGRKILSGVIIAVIVTASLMLLLAPGAALAKEVTPDRSAPPPAAALQGEPIDDTVEVRADVEDDIAAIKNKLTTIIGQFNTMISQLTGLGTQLTTLFAALGDVADQLTDIYTALGTVIAGLEDAVDVLEDILAGVNDAKLALGEILAGIDAANVALTVTIPAAVADAATQIVDAINLSNQALLAALQLHNNVVLGAIGAHNTAVLTGLALHDTNMGAQHLALGSIIGAHDAKMQAALEAHDENLTTRADAIDAAIEELRAKLDNETEKKQIHLQAIQTNGAGRFLLSATEAGLPVDVELMSVKAVVFQDKKPATVFDVTADSTISVVATGMLSVGVALPKGANAAHIWEFIVMDDHGIDPILGPIQHFGTVLVAQGDTED